MLRTLLVLELKPTICKQSRPLTLRYSVSALLQRCIYSHPNNFQGIVVLDSKLLNLCGRSVHPLESENHLLTNIRTDVSLTLHKYYHAYKEEGGHKVTICKLSSHSTFLQQSVLTTECSFWRAIQNKTLRKKQDVYCILLHQNENI